MWQYDATENVWEIRNSMSTLVVVDSGFTIVDDGDATKKIAFQASGITTGTTRTFTVPNYDATLATLAGTETLTNKTLTAPVINGTVTTTGLTLPAFTAGGTITGPVTISTTLTVSAGGAKITGNVGLGLTNPDTALHIKNGSGGTLPTQVGGTDVTQEASGNTYYKFFTPNNKEAGFLWTDPDAVFRGALTYDHGLSNADRMNFYTSGAVQAYLTTAGMVIANGLTVSAGGVVLANNTDYSVKTAGGTTIQLASIDASDQMVIGSNSTSINADSYWQARTRFNFQTATTTPMVIDTNAVANETSLQLLEGSGAGTTRRVKWVDPGTAGANFVAGQRVMVLV